MNSERQLCLRFDGEDERAKLLLNAFQRRGVIGLETEYQHRRRVGSAHQAEAIGEIGAQPVDGGEARIGQVRLLEEAAP